MSKKMERHHAASVNTDHEQTLGPLFDAYGLKWLLIPGYVGLVAALMIFSECSGVYSALSLLHRVS